MFPFRPSRRRLERSLVMSQPRSPLLVLALPAFLVLGSSAAPLRAADAPAVRALRMQQVGDITYFHVQFAMPKQMTPMPGQAARLVPQDGQASHVCQRIADERGQVVPPGGMPGEILERKSDAPPSGRPAPTTRRPAPVDGLEFTGRLRGK